MNSGGQIFFQECHCNLQHVQDLLAHGKILTKDVSENPSKGLVIPFVAMVANHPIYCQGSTNSVRRYHREFSSDTHWLRELYVEFQRSERFREKISARTLVILWSWK